MELIASHFLLIFHELNIWLLKCQMFISVPCNITLGNKNRISFLILQKRVICPKMHSSKEQNFSYIYNFFLPSPCSLITTWKPIQFFCNSISTLVIHMIWPRAQFHFCYTHGYFIFEKWGFLLLPLSTNIHASYLSVLTSCLFTWATSGQHPSPGEEGAKKGGLWLVVALYYAPWLQSQLQIELWKQLLRRQSSYTECGMI